MKSLAPPQIPHSQISAIKLNDFLTRQDTEEDVLIKEIYFEDSDANSNRTNLMRG